MPEANQAPGPSDRVKAIFQSAREEHQKLIREILKEERDVQHMQVAHGIHKNICDHVRRLIK